MASPTAEPKATGFAERGQQVTRLEAFVDAAFAFAVTLLVISFDAIPSNAEELINAFKAIPAFAASFAMVAMFWYAHNVWSRRYGLDDGPSIFLSLLLVFLVLVYVFPLRLVFAGGFAWISGGWLPSDYQISGIGDLQLMFITYACSFISLCSVLALLYRRAGRCAERIGLSANERYLTRVDELMYWLMASVGVISLITALYIKPTWPQWLFGAPGLVYFLLGLDRPLAVRLARGRVGDRPKGTEL